VRLQPTGLGIKAALFYAVVVLVHFAASYSNLYFLLLCFATSLGLYALAAAFRNMAGADAVVAPIEPVAAGMTPRVRAQFTGEPVSAKLELRLEDGSLLEEPLPRGVHAIASARLVSRWPLGLVEASVELEPLEPVIVYPAPILPGEESAGGRSEGDDGVPQAIDGMMQPSSLREYRAGDPLRRIHWRAMARRGEPVVAEWEAGCGEGYEFLIDLRCKEDALERALGRLAGFALMAREEKVPLTLHTQGLAETFGANHRPWIELWRYLAMARRVTVQSSAPPPVGTHVVRLTA
jgi:uncharacterized protein (DUF58 family)